MGDAVVAAFEFVSLLFLVWRHVAPRGVHPAMPSFFWALQIDEHQLRATVTASEFRMGFPCQPVVFLAEQMSPVYGRFH